MLSIAIAPSPFGTISRVCGPFDSPLASVICRTSPRSTSGTARSVSVNSGMASSGRFKAFRTPFLRVRACPRNLEIAVIDHHPPGVRDEHVRVWLAAHVVQHVAILTASVFRAVEFARPSNPVFDPYTWNVKCEASSLSFETTSFQVSGISGLRCVTRRRAGCQSAPNAGVAVVKAQSSLIVEGAFPSMRTVAVPGWRSLPAPSRQSTRFPVNVSFSALSRLSPMAERPTKRHGFAVNTTPSGAPSSGSRLAS